MTNARPPILTLTKIAAKRVRYLMARSSKSINSGLKIGVKKGGCAGMEYTISHQEFPDPGDDVIEMDGARIFIDPSALLFLLGSEMDYEEGIISSGFKFKNPNQTSTCGCGESVNLSMAELKNFDFSLHVK